MRTELRFRQVHLDFHTSEIIPGIGAEFDPERFVRTLRAAAVDSITCFSRCHHGWIYHDTQFPNRHPHLTCNLLVEQVRACHAADIRVPVYITVGWDHLMATSHPEWCEFDEKGKLCGRGPLDEYGWTNLDFASPYVDYLEAQTSEVMDLLGDEFDGAFFDIIFQRGVHGKYCLERFRKLGWDPADAGRQEEMRLLLVSELTDRLGAVVRNRCPEATIFFNGGHVGPDFRARLRNYSHLEIESLPSGGWGYMHFPMTARYARTLGLDFLGMTGKFSETWGHFGSYKNPAALEYECFSALAHGGKCSVGDQLPPTGVLDAATYDLIGGVYRQIAEVEPWCLGAKSVAEIAVLNAEAFDRSTERMDPRNLGAVRMLMEGRHQFDLVDPEQDLSSYRVLVVPDGIRLPNVDFMERLVAAGGAVLAAGEALLAPDGEHWPVFSPAVAQVQGLLPFSPDFLRPTAASGLREDTDFVMYERGVALEAAEGAEVLATVTDPYFERTWNAFCSHNHTPADRSTLRPGALIAGRLAVFAHPVFTTYARHSMSFHRDLVLAAIRRLLPVPLIECSGPTSMQASLTRQGDRHILHLLHYIPERRGLNLDVVEDPVPVLPTEVRVRLQGSSAQLVPSGVKVPVRREGEVSVLEVPAFLGRQMICLNP